MSTAKREAISKAAALVRPALSTKEYIPALMHIQFSGGRAVAYNDISAISVECESPVDCCVPGELLIRSLSGFGGAEVSMQIDGNGTLLLKSGRSNLKLPTLSSTAFPFDPPNPNDGDAVTFSRDIVKGIECCLISVSNDSAHPAQMGVTIDATDGKAVLYSTDNYSVSRYQSSAKIKLPGDAPVIMPRFFCEQLIGLAKSFPTSSLEFVMYPGALVLEVGDGGVDAILFTKTPVDLEPMDFPRIVNKHIKLDDIKDTMQPIPDNFDSALGRSLLVLGSEPMKKTHVGTGDGLLMMNTSSSMGAVDDTMPFDIDPLDFDIDPALVSRGAKACSLMYFTERVTVLADEDAVFVHLVAHRTA